MAETYPFHRTTQSEDQNVMDYANKLKRFAISCNFGNYLPRALRGQFVAGVYSQSTRKKLLSEDRTLEQALAVAVADETAGKEVKQFHCPQPGVSCSVDFTANTKKKNNARVLGYKECSDKAIVPFSEGKHCRCGSS